MRVAIVAGPYIPVPPKRYGGVEQVVYYLIKGLQNAGHTPILLASGDSTVNCETIPIVSSALAYPLTRKEIAGYRQLEAVANKKIIAELHKLLPTIDIIHSHNFDLLPFKDFPNVTTLHGMFEFSQLDYYTKHHALNYVSISDNQRCSYPNLNYVATVYNGEKPDLFPIVTKPEDYLCFLGRFDWDKSPHNAIQLALSLNMKIKIAGKIDFKGETYFHEKIEPHLNHPLVEYLGELDFDAKVRLLSNAVCNLHPTNFREPFGLTVLEAAYCGTPTLATDRGAMRELIEPGHTGIVVEDFVEGVHAIKECFKMDRKYIAERARRIFNDTNMTNDYINVYEKVIKASAKQRSLT